MKISTFINTNKYLKNRWKRYKYKEKENKDIKKTRLPGGTKTSNNSEEAKDRQLHPQAVRLLEFYSFIKELHYRDRYLAGSDYRGQLKEYFDMFRFFATLESAGAFERFCSKQGWRAVETQDKIRRILKYGESLSRHVKKHNDRYVFKELESEKDYLDHILEPVDPAIRLDENQRKVILSDEDYTLVIAGAGAGKTTTVAAKVQYLVERKKVPPDKILVISFTNKAVSELRTRINKNLGIPCPIGTFHSAGNTILKRSREERPGIVEGNVLYRQVENYICNTVMKDERAVHDLIMFFGAYFDASYDGNDLERYLRGIASGNYVTMKSELNEYRRDIISRRSRKKLTIQAEILRSKEEVEIANFLYLQGLDYSYEETYPYYLLGTDKPYTPDFLIKQGDLEVWLEHFGVSEDGKNSCYSEEELEKYKAAANHKYIHHKRHGTRLIVTYSSYADGRSRLDHLEEKLVNAGFVLKPRSEKEILIKLTEGEQSRYVRRLIVLVCRFIDNFKINGYGLSDFERMRKSTKNVRNQLFLSIGRDCYIEYQRYLQKNNLIDFQDMINESARLLLDYQDKGEILDFQYIIVDEYQDISRQRFDLVRALRDISHARIIAVGDDWQSIYAFSGSDITLFTRFSEKMGYADQLTIDRTYRNSQELIDIAGGFIQKNQSQIKKALISDRHIPDPVIIYTYDAFLKRNIEDPYSGVDYAIAKCAESAIEQIVAYANEEGRKEKKILLLGRFGFDGKHLEHTGLFEYLDYGNRLRCLKYPEIRIDFMTAHASKGLGYDDVIVLNGRNAKYGFPAKIEDDPVLKFVVHEDQSMEYAEERRLFYVAMTRTKNRVFFIAPEQNPSEFLLELKRDYKHITLKGSWNDQDIVSQKGYKPCPICGYPLKLRYKPSYGLRLYICSNEPEICDFMTNDIGGGRLSICKCNRCRDGYLIVRRSGKGNYFLGCTNYRSDKRGCNQTRNG